MPPKFRLFAGPNGSGKTSLFDNLKKGGFIHTELYINADRIERELKENLYFNFNAYRVKVSQDDFSDNFNIVAIKRNSVLSILNPSGKIEGLLK
jgi:predicted ABC-type ATPase